MILRIWRTELNPARLDEYARFEQERSLPMFREQRGLLGVLFLREGPDRAAALTIWEDRAAVEALGDSPSYQQTAAALMSSGLLVGEPSVDVFDVAGGELRTKLLAAVRQRTL